MITKNPVLSIVKQELKQKKTTIKLKKAGLSCDYFHGGLDKVMKKTKIRELETRANTYYGSY